MIDVMKYLWPEFPRDSLAETEGVQRGLEDVYSTRHGNRHDVSI